MRAPARELIAVLVETWSVVTDYALDVCLAFVSYVSSDRDRVGREIGKCCASLRAALHKPARTMREGYRYAAILQLRS